MADSRISVESLLEAGAHFGHITRRWNPKMRKFIFNERNGIHIIDLRKTQILIEYARDIIYDIASQGRIILFVGTKQQAKSSIEEQAQKASMNYVSERWLGGMLTNFATIRRSIRRLTDIDRMEKDGTFDRITKKERLMLTRERERLRKVFGGIENMMRLPGAIFVVDAKKEHLAVKEARVLGIPVIGIIDTNTDPDMVDYPIPANDDSVQAIEIITSVMADAIIEGTKIAKVRKAELGYDPREKDIDEETAEKGQRKFRGRGDGRGERGARDGGRDSGRPSRGGDRSGGDRGTRDGGRPRTGSSYSSRPANANQNATPQAAKPETQSTPTVSEA
jgi:small subunit ribosomal protein S2